MREWERELGVTFSPAQLQKIVKLSHVSSITTKTQELCYKCTSHWYKTPARLARVFPGVSPNCLRGCVHLWDLWEELSPRIKLPQVH